MESSRRNPDELLRALDRTSSAKRGKLRVFLGMCPGVGKTYAMLKAARDQRERGVSVLIGVVETHGRKETEDLLEGLEMLGKKEIVYKDTTLYEMDLDRILQKRPALVLVDELAHTNVPGSRHLKRYQDVDELLKAGIDVYTTVNIQHIESRNDQVAQITSVQVRETVPDAFLELAHQLEVVDLAPSELLQRLREGKVYLGDRADRAAEGFFKEEHLLALRELALRFVAEKVDQDLNAQMTIKGIEGPWQTNERLLVAVSHSPYSARLIRTARRMAYNLDAPWIALYVNTGETLLGEDERTLQKNIALARDLGAEVITVAHKDVVQAIQQMSHSKNVTQIIMGRPDRRMISDFFARGSLLDKLVRDTSKVDVHVIRAERKPRYKGFHFNWPELQTGFFPYYNTGWFLIAVFFFCYALIPIVGYRALGSVFLLSILAVASFTRGGPIFFAALASAVIWNFFFIPPTLTFSIGAFEDIMMVVSFFVTALVAGLLTSRIRRQEKVLETRENQTRLLYDLVKSLADIKDENQVVRVLHETIVREFRADNVIFLSDAQGKIDGKSSSRVDEKDFAVARWAFENNKPAGWSTQTLNAAQCLCLPMRGNSGVVGVLVLYPVDREKPLTIEKENFLETVVAQTSIALERVRFREAAHTAKIYEASEKLHQTLLNSVSHELRTPITALIGSASALKDDKTLADSKAREAMTDELITSARRLDRVVENLLDVSRIEMGTLHLKNEWFDLGDLLSGVGSELREELGQNTFSIRSEGTLLLEGDYQLLDHAFAQLVLNAIKHSKSESSVQVIQVTFGADQGSARVLIRDEGQGIPPGMESQIFEKFFRIPGTPAGGLGLGLAIVKSIVELHGGSVLARNRSDQDGAEFEVRLPMKTAPRALQEALQ